MLCFVTDRLATLRGPKRRLWQTSNGANLPIPQFIIKNDTEMLANVLADAAPNSMIFLNFSLLTLDKTVAVAKQNITIKAVEGVVPKIECPDSGPAFAIR